MMRFSAWLHCQVCQSPHGFVVCFCVFEHTNQQSLAALFLLHGFSYDLLLNHYYDTIRCVDVLNMQLYFEFLKYTMLIKWQFCLSLDQMDFGFVRAKIQVYHTCSIPAQTHISHIHSYMNIQTKYYLLILTNKSKTQQKDKEEGAQTVCL